ncbi:MAG: fdrA domain protein [Candidatus Bathyarchaeota archaeon]|nr:fdrA domain protein [Candidatus Bathyarchaeota archaeon]
MKDLLREELKIVNIGIINFYEDYKKQDVVVVHVDWRPPGTGDAKLDELLDKIM